MTTFAITTTLRTSLQEARAFVEHYRSLGAEKIYLFFDDPEDPVFIHLKDEPSVVATACHPSHWTGGQRPSSIEERQIFNCGLALGKARAEGIDWLAHVDCDELIICQSNLRKELAAIEERFCAIRFRLLEAAPQKLHYTDQFSEVDLFKSKPTRLQTRLAKILGTKGITFNDRIILGHTASKIAVRTAAEVGEFGIHTAKDKDGKRLPEIDSSSIKLLHFDCCGFEDFYRKWHRRIDGSGFATELAGPRKVQFERFKKAFSLGKDAVQSLYEEIYFLSPWDRWVLRALGVLKTIRVREPTR